MILATLIGFLFGFLFGLLVGYVWASYKADMREIQARDRIYQTQRSGSVKSPLPDQAICAHCVHLIRTSDSGQWYDMYCGALPRDASVDYATGKHRFVQRGDDGREVLADERYPHCREINRDGHCDIFVSSLSPL